MLQKIIVAIIVLAAVVYLVAKVVRTTGGKGGCGCGCQNCPATGRKECHCHDK